MNTDSLALNNDTAPRHCVRRHRDVDSTWKRLTRIKKGHIYQRKAFTVQAVLFIAKHTINFKDNYSHVLSKRFH
jgi:hypothetical protein